MTNELNKRIDTAAGVAIAEWESRFSQELLTNAKDLAIQSNAGLVTLDHLQAVAGTTIEKLLVTINGEQGTDGQRKAA